MELLKIENGTQKYQKNILLETALAWNSLKKFLEKKGKSELFEYITAIKISEKSIKIITKKPLVKQELNLMKEEIFEAINPKLLASEKVNRNLKIV